MSQFDTATASNMINALKEKTYVSSDDLAKAIGVSRRTVYRLSRGEAEARGTTKVLLWVLCNSFEARELCGFN